MAEGARLESVLRVTPYEGSNPSLSAIKANHLKQLLINLQPILNNRFPEFLV